MLVLLPFTEWLRNFYLGLVRQTITSRRLLPDKDISFLVDCVDNFDEWFTHMLKLEMLSNLKKKKNLNKCVGHWCIHSSVFI